MAHTWVESVDDEGQAFFYCNACGFNAYEGSVEYEYIKADREKENG